MGYVYLINAENTNMYKIGRTAKFPSDRLSGVQTGNPHKLIVVHALNSDDFDSIELWLHREFKKFRRSGEWFEFDKSTLYHVRMAFIEAEFGFLQRSKEMEQLQCKLSAFESKLKQIESRLSSVESHPDPTPASARLLSQNSIIEPDQNSMFPISEKRELTDSEKLELVRQAKLGKFNYNGAISFNRACNFVYKAKEPFRFEHIKEVLGGN